MEGKDMADNKSTVNKPPAIGPANTLATLSEDIEPVYVPVVNVNYLPEGIVRLEGYVPPINGGVPWDTNVQMQKDLLEGVPAGPGKPLESGPTDENDWVDPATKEPEADNSLPDDNDPNSPAVTGGEPGDNVDETSPLNDEEPNEDNTSGIPVASSTSNTASANNTTQEDEEKLF
jgi:hypothetical protein